MRSVRPLLLVMPLLAACVVRSGPSHDTNNTNNNPNPQPITVVVDTNQTMTDTPGGDGVGVFVQYASGGHWHAWWTCDTNRSGLPCDFTVQVSGSNVANATPTFFETSPNLTSTSNGFVATTHTTTSVNSVDFDAAPGTNVTVDVAVSGLRDGGFFFWVGDDANGKPAINGNYQGQLSDPLIFQPSSP